MPDPTPPPVETDAGQMHEFDLERLRAENGRLKTALGFYANPKCHSPRYGPSEVDCDEGAIARAALAGDAEKGVGDGDTA